jgi:hypothetical protein
MKKERKHRGRGWIIFLLVIVLLAAAIWFIGLPMANRTAAKYVDSAIQDALSSPQMPDVDYQNVVIDAAQGAITLSDLQVPLEGSVVSAQQVRIKVAPSELVSIALGQASGLSGAEVELEKFIYRDDQIHVDLGDADITIGGSIDIQHPDKLLIRDVAVVSSDVIFTDPVSNFRFSSDTLDLDLSGRMTAATLEKDFAGILDDIAYVDLKSSGGSVQLDTQMMDQLALFTEVSPWIADPQNWTFNDVAVEARTLEQAVAVDKLSIAAPLMDASGSAQIPKEEGGPLSLKLDVQEVHSQVRSELTPLLGFFGQSIPEGAFTFEFDWQGSGMPAMILR